MFSISIWNEIYVVVILILPIVEKEQEYMSDETGWNVIELRDKDTLDKVLYEFIQRYHIVHKKQYKTALLLTNDEPGNDKQPPPPVLYYYLSPAGVHMMGDLLDPNGARDCPKPPHGKRYFVEGDWDYFLSIQVADKGQ